MELNVLALPVDAVPLYPAGMLLKVELFPPCVFFLSKRERNGERLTMEARGLIYRFARPNKTCVCARRSHVVTLRVSVAALVVGTGMHFTSPLGTDQPLSLEL